MLKKWAKKKTAPKILSLQTFEFWRQKRIALCSMQKLKIFWSKIRFFLSDGRPLWLVFILFLCVESLEESYFPLRSTPSIPFFIVCIMVWDNTILDRERDTKRRLTSVDKSQAVIVVAPLRIPLLCQPVSSLSSQLSQLCRILPPHILCFCIRHAWLVFMKYFFLFLKNTTFIFKGHYQYMSMIIMKLSPPPWCWGVHL